MVAIATHLSVEEISCSVSIFGQMVGQKSNSGRYPQRSPVTVHIKPTTALKREEFLLGKHMLSNGTRIIDGLGLIRLFF